MRHQSSVQLLSLSSRDFALYTLWSEVQSKTKDCIDDNVFFQAETVDMGFGKLSPRAFLQPGNVIRSPSAPPIPYFPHHDSDEDDDDTESEDDPFVRSIISRFNRDRVLDLGEENPRRYSEGYALGRQVSPWQLPFNLHTLQID